MDLSALLKFNLRYYRRHVMLSLLCLTGIALGVGIVVAVELINHTALSSFASSVDLLAGRATHCIVSDYGRIDEKAFSRVWKNPNIEAASPIVEVMASALETGDEPIRFVGIDPFLAEAFRGPAPPGDEGSLEEFLAGDLPSAYLSRRVMNRHGLKRGDILRVLSAGIERRVRILGSISPPAHAELDENVALMDISSAQEVFGRTGYLDRIDLIVREHPAEIIDSLPQGLRLSDPNARKSALKAMLYSFQLNLAAMSLLALFVGTFLIYNFSMFSVLARREDMSLLLTLGAGRKDMVLAFLTESLLFGAAGSLVGIGFGFLVAWFSVERVSSTITELYFYVAAERVRLTPQIVFIGLGVGFLATLVGTVLPALEVAVTPPVLGIQRRSIEDRAHGLKGTLSVIGLFLFLAALVSAWASRFSIFWGFVSAFGMTLDFALLTPWMLAGFTHHSALWLKRLLRSPAAFLAARSIRASLSRTSIAVAALAVALSMTIGVDTMIFSFRKSVAAWLEGSVQGDLYVSPSTTKWDHPLPDSLVTAMKQDPRVDAVERYATHEVYLAGKAVRLRVIDAAVLKRYSRFIFLKGDAAAWDAMIKGEIFISEPLAYRFGLNPGDKVTLGTPEGPRSFAVAAVVRDYSSDQGAIQMDRNVYEIIWKDKRVQSIALFLKAGASADDVRRSMIADFPGLDRSIVTSSKMKETVLLIFDKTFAPTATLKGVSLLVALLGIATALTAILMERSRETTVLGYLGLTPGEMGRMNFCQALLMGLAAYLVAVFCGPVITYIIVYAINYRSFGWSIDIFISPWIFAKALLLTMAACMAAAFYPSLKLVRTRTAVSLTEE